MKMADFCHQCTFELFGEGYAPFNDFADLSIADDEMQRVLCEGCGYIQVDNKGRRLRWDDELNIWRTSFTCPHNVEWNLCRVVVEKNNKDRIAYVSNLNFHGIGEFIAQYPEGDASSDDIKDYIPTCNTWIEIERLLTP